jgi:acetate kinase
MNIFVINTGSSSIKYQLFSMPSTKPICIGLVERIGMENTKITHKIFIDGIEKSIVLPLNDSNHDIALGKVSELLVDQEYGVIFSSNDIEVVGHRIVHGGEAFTQPTIVTEEVMEKLKSTFQLAPLHNPAGYEGIQVAEKVFCKAKQVLIFDTAFHQTMPAIAYRYAIPNTFYDENNIRAYGFHGTSHKFISEEATRYLNNYQLKLISIHLGNGCSIAAIKNGKCIDTSMGFGPLSGLIMGTRSGDIDPTVIFYLVNTLGYKPDEVNNLLNKKSGMLGLTGHSDMRDIRKAIEAGDEVAKLAYEMYAYRIKKYIGAYMAALNGLDAIVFTAGVGENDQLIREMVCVDMEHLGIQFDEVKNGLKESNTREINLQNSKVKILVIPTNEELEIANQCFNLLK